MNIPIINGEEGHVNHKCNSPIGEKSEIEAKPGDNVAATANALLGKSTCPDVYLNAKVDGLNMYEVRSKKVMHKYKHDRALIERKMNRIRVIMSLAGL